MKIRKIIIIIALILLTIDLFIIIYYRYSANIITDITSNLVDNKVIVSYKVLNYKINSEVYATYTLNEELPNDDSEWIICDQTCEFVLESEPIYIYLKNSDGDIYFVENSNKIGYIENLIINKEKLYLSIDSTYTLTVKYNTIGFVEKMIDWKSSDESIAQVDAEGKVTGISDGVATITSTIDGKSVSATVFVTSLINKVEKEFDYSKPFLTCNRYSNEENELLDNILMDRINEAGYQTRAGVVEAARFLTLEFPYKISYFHENGRLTTNYIDGEGRYYHIGLYLSDSKFNDIKSSKYKPSIWGCQLYSYPKKEYEINGLDCSGFVSWAIYNGGFDIKDFGAGIEYGYSNDLTDFGEITSLSLSQLDSGRIKVGDLLHSYHAGGHIAIIIGIDENYYYVAQALWKEASNDLINNGLKEDSLQVIKYTKNELINTFKEIVYMDNYYKNDGNLTNMWY